MAWTPLAREAWAQFVRARRHGTDEWTGLPVDLNPAAIRGVLEGPHGVDIELWLEGEAGAVRVVGTMAEVRAEIDRAMAVRAAILAGTG